MAAILSPLAERTAVGSVPRKNRASTKRGSTRPGSYSKNETATGTNFLTIRNYGASVRDIVQTSGLSPGTFYNYYRTKEAVFAVILRRLLERIRDEIKVARVKADDLEGMLLHGYRAFLDLLQSIDGARRFCELNQHHIRAQFFATAA